jgi:LEA14-like dessication related protein
MTRTSRSLFLLVPLLGSSVGCAELEAFLPTVNFDTMRVRDIDFERAEVDFVFQVDNPNPVQVSLSSFSYGLGLEGIELLDGDDADGFTLDAAGASELSLPVSLAWDDAWSAVQATRGLDQVNFGLDGHFGFETPLGEARLPYAEQGDFPAVRRPQFAWKKLRVDRFDLLNQTATLALDLDVDNAHGSKLDFERLRYRVSFAGQRVANGNLPAFDVEGATARTITLPLTVDLLSVGSEVVDAIRDRRPLDVGLDADVDVVLPFLDQPVLPLHIDQSGRVSVE